MGTIPFGYLHNLITKKKTLPKQNMFVTVTLLTFKTESVIYVIGASNMHTHIYIYIYIYTHIYIYIYIYIYMYALYAQSASIF